MTERIGVVVRSASGRGWDTFLAGAVLGLLYGGLTGARMIALRRATRHTQIPLGPALITGAFTTLLAPIG